MSLGLFSAVGGFYGGSIGSVLAYWEEAGFFAYALPFLLIFAVVYGILTKVQTFGEQKGLNAVIAIVVGLLALQFDFVPIFFSEIFPRVGVGLSVILALFILVGLFLPSGNSSVANWILLAVGVVIFIVVVTNTFGFMGYQSGIFYFMMNNLPAIIGIVLVLAAIGVTVGINPNPDLGKWEHPPQWQKK